MARSIPTIRRRWWHRLAGETPGELAANLPPIGAQALVAWTATGSAFLAAAGTAAWLGVVSVLKVAKAVKTDRKEADDISVRDLHGCLHVVYEVVRRHKGIVTYEEKDLARFRITVHNVVGGELEQSVPYVGGCRNDLKPAGRRFPLRCGIIGMVARTGETGLAVRTTKDQAEYLKELVKDWGYKADEAAKLSADRWSSMAVPVMGDQPGVPIAVLYADSNDPEFFTEKAQELLVAAATGLATWIKLRYLSR